MIQLQLHSNVPENFFEKVDDITVKNLIKITDETIQQINYTGFRFFLNNLDGGFWYLVLRLQSSEFCKSTFHILVNNSHPTSETSHIPNISPYKYLTS